MDTTLLQRRPTHICTLVRCAFHHASTSSSARSIVRNGRPKEIWSVLLILTSVASLQSLAYHRTLHAKQNRCAWSVCISIDKRARRMVLKITEISVLKRVSISTLIVASRSHALLPPPHCSHPRPLVCVDDLARRLLVLVS